MKSQDSHVAVCPDDEMLAAMIESRFSGIQLARLESHVATCSTCLDVVASALPAVSGATATADRRRDLSRGTSPGSRVLSRRSWRRWAIAATLLVAAGGIILGATARPTEWNLAPKLARLGSRALGIPVAFRALDFQRGDRRASFVVTLRDVSMGHSSASARADEVGITIALGAIFYGEPLIAGIRLTGPEFVVPGGDPQELTWSRAERAQVLAVLARTGRIEVLNARALLPGADGSSVMVEDLTGGMERRPGGASLALQGETMGGTVDLVGHLGWNADDLLVTIGGRDLEVALLPIAGERLRGRMEVRVDVTSRGGRLRARGRAAVRGGQLIGRGPMALLHLRSETREILADLDQRLADDDLSFDDARAIFSWRRGTWRFSRIFLTYGHLVAGGRGRVDTRGFLRGYGTLRVPAALASALQPHEPSLLAFRDGNGAVTLPFVVRGSLQVPQITLGRP